MRKSFHIATFTVVAACASSDEATTVDVAGTTISGVVNECFPDGIPVETGIPYVQVLPLHAFANPQVGGGFASAEGGHPRSGVLVASDGRLYGTTETNGPNMTAGCNLDDQSCPGTVYSMKERSGADFRVVHAFSANNAGNATGYQSTATLVEANGHVYGTTIGGGLYNNGVIYNFPLSNPATFTTFSFPANAVQLGRNPYGGLISNGAGTFYGATHNGGNGLGVIYAFDGTTATRVAAFDALDADPLSDCARNFDREYQNANGGAPFGSLVLGPDQKLRGIAPYGGRQKCVIGAPGTTAADTCTGCGGAFTTSVTDGNLQLSPFAPPYTFRGNGDQAPIGGLILASDGNYYGTNEFGGISTVDGSANGIIFRMTPAGVITIIHEFPPYLSSSACGLGKTYCNRGTPASADDRGGQPTGSLVEGNDGLLYGTTRYGGDNGNGTIFQVTKDGTKFLALHDFSDDSPVAACHGANREGARPAAGFARSTDGAYLYTTTRAGGGADQPDGYRGYGTVVRMRAPLSFDEVRGANTNVFYVSEAIRVSIISKNTIAVPAGSPAYYSVNFQPFTNLPGVVAQGDTLRIRMHSASTCNTSAPGTIRIGSLNISFVVMTKPC